MLKGEAFLLIWILPTIDDCFPDFLELVALELLCDQDIGQIGFCNKIDGYFVCATAFEF